MNALKEQIGRMVRVLFTVHNATTVSVKKLRKGRHDTIGIGSMHAENARRRRVVVDRRRGRREGHVEIIIVLVLVVLGRLVDGRKSL